MLETARKLSDNPGLAWGGKDGKLMAALKGPRGERGVTGEEAEQVEDVFRDDH